MGFLLVGNREYQDLQRSRSMQRANFRRESRRRQGRRTLRYPTEMGSLPKFPIWLRNKVASIIDEQGPHSISRTVVDLSRPPKPCATSFRSMRAYGMHLRCKSAEICADTMDSGVAVLFLPRMTSNTLRHNEVSSETTEYVGWIEEILELDYRRHCVIVLLCSWVKARHGGPNPTVRRDRYGFTSVKFTPDSVMGLSADSFAFPIHVQQVFFAPDTEDPEWKVVCKVVVRGRRGEREFESSPSADILSIGHDASFEGLSALPSEGQPESSTNARVPAVDVVVDMAIAEEGTDFISEGETRMLGDSSADE